MKGKKILLSFILTSSFLVSKEVNGLEVLEPVETIDIQKQTITTNKKYKKNKNIKIKQNPIIQILKELNLSDEQKTELILLNKEKKNRLDALDKHYDEEKMLDYYSTKGFDIDKFKQDLTNNYKKLLDIRAEYIQKSFDILLPKQKEEFIIKLNKIKESLNK